jgi:hypothetical protein
MMFRDDLGGERLEAIQHRTQFGVVDLPRQAGVAHHVDEPDHFGALFVARFRRCQRPARVGGEMPPAHEVLHLLQLGQQPVDQPGDLALVLSEFTVLGDQRQ